MIKVLGYYIDRLDEGETVDSSTVFVAFEADGEVQCYAPVGQHSDLKDLRYLEECQEITVDEYVRISKNLYTPEDYLGGVTSAEGNTDGGN